MSTQPENTESVQASHASTSSAPARVAEPVDQSTNQSTNQSIHRSSDFDDVPVKRYTEDDDDDDAENKEPVSDGISVLTRETTPDAGPPKA